VRGCARVGAVRVWRSSGRRCRAVFRLRAAQPLPVALRSRATLHACRWSPLASVCDPLAGQAWLQPSRWYGVVIGVAGGPAPSAVALTRARLPGGYFPWSLYSGDRWLDNPFDLVALSKGAWLSAARLQSAAPSLPMVGRWSLVLVSCPARGHGELRGVRIWVPTQV